MYKMPCIVVFVLLVPLALSAQDISGWRVPMQSELADNLGWRKEDPNLYISAKADFDGDGEDEARLLVNDKENKMGLFVTLSSRKKSSTLLLETMDDKKWIEVMGVSVAKPGKYRTACGKGYFECEKSEPEEMNLKLPTVDFFKEGSAYSFFAWDKKGNRFKRIWMSD